jgi:hypothetical protein
MIITLVIVALLALIFGKITFKELKEHVSKYRAERYKGDNRADGRDHCTGAGDRKEGGEERIPEEGCEKGEDRTA